METLNNKCVEEIRIEKESIPEMKATLNDQSLSVTSPSPEKYEIHDLNSKLGDPNGSRTLGNKNIDQNISQDRNEIITSHCGKNGTLVMDKSNCRTTLNYSVISSPPTDEMTKNFDQNTKEVDETPKEFVRDVKDDTGDREKLEDLEMNIDKSKEESLLAEIIHMTPEDGDSNVSLRQNITLKLASHRQGQKIEVRRYLDSNEYQVVDGIIAEVDGCIAFAPTLLLLPHSRYQVIYSAGNMYHKTHFTTGGQCNIKFQIKDLKGNISVVDVAFAENRSQWDDFVEIVCHHIGIKKEELDKFIVTDKEGKSTICESTVCIRELVQTDMISVKTKEIVHSPHGKVSTLAMDNSVSEVAVSPTDERKKTTTVGVNEIDSKKRNVVGDDLEGKQSYVKLPIAKRFPRMGVYFGIVEKYLVPEEEDDEDLWKICYDDGDAEDFNFEELKKGLALYEKMQKKKTASEKSTVSGRRSSTERSRSMTPAKRRAVNDKNGVKSKKNGGTTKVKDDSSEREFVVEELLECRISDEGKEEYLVKWRNYDSEDNSWEPIENLNCVKLLEKFKSENQ